LSGKIEGQPSPADEIGGSSNPSSFLFIKETAERLFGAVPAVLFAAYAGFLFGVLSGTRGGKTGILPLCSQ